VIEPARRAALVVLVRWEQVAAGGSPRVVRAPLPGRIVRIWVGAGDQVETGARLCSLEAMKMENEIFATGSGTIERVSVEPALASSRGTSWW
jgi:biotin carboxyl carrier protein